ncbi:MAG: hypothetical protein FH761_07120 [Firmicutes bacterium]|nr:hypothetical protein [Bacillota bacterium]
MTTSYSCFQINKFPFSEEKKFLVPYQESFKIMEGTPETYFKLFEKNFHDSFDKYFAHHEMTIKKHGKVFGKYFHEYLEPKDFSMYVSSKYDLLFTKVNKDLSTDFIKNCNRYSSYLNGFNCVRKEVDFEKIAHILPVITGAWVGKLKSTYVKSSAYFGRHVDRSDRFKEAASEGKISFLQFEYIKDNTSYTVGIPEEAAIILYNNFDDKKIELELVKEIYDKFINL